MDSSTPIASNLGGNSMNSEETPITPITPSLENSLSFFASSVEHSITALINSISTLRQEDKVDLESLPKIDSGKPNVCGWYSKFTSWLEYQNIKDPELIFKLCKMATPDDHTEDLDELLIEDDDGNIVYPQLFTIKKKLLRVIEGDKDPLKTLEKIKTFSISHKQTISDFNREYKKLYRKLDKKYKNAITVFDYLNSIRSRSEACKGIYINKCTKLEEAYELAERYEEAYLKYTVKKTPVPTNSYYNNPFKSSTSKPNNPNEVPGRKVTRENHVKDVEDITKGVKELRIKTCYFC